MSRSPATSGKAMATKSLKEKWLSMVQSARENGENGIGGFSTVTILMKRPTSFETQWWKGSRQGLVMKLELPRMSGEAEAFKYETLVCLYCVD